MSKQEAGSGRPPEGRDDTSEPVVLGEQIAKAAAAEKRRKAGGELGKSPMPGARYDWRDDELGLLRPRPALLDSALAGVTREYAKADEHARADVRRCISMEEFYTLLTFGRRAAVFALRERGVRRVTEGLTAVAMIEAERVDWRDILVALGLLNHAAERVGADADRLFREAGGLAEPEVARLIDGFGRRRPAEKDLRSSWGYEEVEVGRQVGLIGWGMRPWRPLRDLPKAAIEIADFLARDQYRPDSVEIATELPAVWLRTNDDATLGKAMKGIRACATIHAGLRPGECPDPNSQMFVVFLVETADESSARTLLQLAREKKPKDYAMIGVAEKDLFCLVIARSWVGGVASFETTEKLGRFSNGLADVLHRHTR